MCPEAWAWGVERTEMVTNPPYDEIVTRRVETVTRGLDPKGTDPKSTEAATKAERTRVRILDAAAATLSQRGYSGTRLSDVAEAARLQTPAIYYHFASREDLIEEVMFVGMADMRSHLTGVLEALPDDTTSMQRVLAAVEAHLRHELLLSDYTTATIRNAGQVPAELRTRQAKEQTKYGEIWRDLVQVAQDDGVLRPELDPRLARQLVVGALNWAAEWWTPRRGSIDALVQNAQDLVRFGMFVPEAR